MYAMRKDAGATMLEMVATIAILGILALGALQIVTNVTEGWLQVRNESASAENIQAALTRITHEIGSMDTKRPYTFTSTSITYYYKADAAQSIIQLSGTNLLLNGNVLLNNLISGSGFQVTAPNYSVNPAAPVGIQLSVQVTGASATVTKTYTAKIELNTQRFQ